MPRRCSTAAPSSATWPTGWPCRTESQNAERAAELRRYLSGQIAPSLAALGFTSQIHPNPVPGAPGPS
jgi:hypothetical protein